MASVWLRTCEQDTREPIEGKITGNIPEWLQGRLTRNGPGKVSYGKTKYNHIFDGSSYLHQFHIEGGKVTYRARFLESDTYKRNTKANRIVVSEFGTSAYPDPCKTLFQRFLAVFQPLNDTATDNCLVNVAPLGDRIFALTETCKMREIDPTTLECIGKATRLDKHVAVNQATAHPHIDPDGTVYNMGNSYQARTGPTYNIIQFPPAKTDENGKRVSSMEQAKIVCSIPSTWKTCPSYYHSFGITDNYFIFIEQPLVFNLTKFLVNHYVGRPYLGAIDWYPDRKTSFRVVNRATGEMVPIDFVANAFFTFHHINAYEEDGHLVVDVCAMEDGQAVKQLFLEELGNPDFESKPATMPKPRRFVLPLQVNEASKDQNLVTLESTKCTAVRTSEGNVLVTSELLTEYQYFDLPRINYTLNGKDYTYAFGVEVSPRGIQFSKLVKLNVKTKEKWLWHEEGKLVSEPVFVPAPDSLHELDGVILFSLMSKADPNYVALVLLNPRDWGEIARAEFEAAGAVTSTFHGIFAGTKDKIHRL
ncbi:beta,beta-carotene 15,15'-dioxygenase-like isoform X2 [Oratosquilla oratoria]|uniref:beta,beta-carotene 15,15'-dioxygenase-like isoform X2 n=1 Tax=Oratosquilla oratoria TaxID=337810 RepID=UPI003F767529